MSSSVLAIGAHPDDIELGAAGTVALHDESGDDVVFVIVTRGGADGIDPAIREREAMEAAAHVGVTDVRFLGYPDTEVPYDKTLIQRIEDVVLDIDPDRVYFHTKYDTHQDHRKTSLAALTATRNVDRVFAYESPSSTSEYSPEYFTVLPESSLERKVEAIQIHESQAGKDSLEAEAMRGLARFRGRQANAVYAESFQVIRATERLQERTR